MAGLKQVLKDVPVRTGYVEALATISTATGPVARLEAGYRPSERSALFAFVEGRPRDVMAGIGARLEFGL